MEVHIDTPSKTTRLTIQLGNPVRLSLFRISHGLAQHACILTSSLKFLGDHELAVHSVSSNIHTILFPDTTSRLTVTPSTNSLSLNVCSETSDYVQADVDLHPSRWFGLGHLMHHHWPLDNAALVCSPAYPFDNGPTGFSTLFDPTFLSSSAALLSVDDRSPCLHIAINPPVPTDVHIHTPTFKWTTGLGNLLKQILPERCGRRAPRLLSIQSRSFYDHTHVSHPWSTFQQLDVPKRRVPSLSFSLSSTANIREAAIFSLANVRATYGPTSCSPTKLKMMQHPIWSTWAQFKRDIDQEKIVKFAQRIAASRLSHSVMGIDDRWSSSYGELRFDEVKFPDPAKMVEQLHSLGFMVTLWVTPFANSDSSPIVDSNTRRYYVAMPDGNIGQFEWWQPGHAAALDVTNPEACEWFVSQLQSLQENYHVDGFKFDAGEPCFLTPGSVLHRKLESPNDYTRKWIQNIASKFPVAEVRSAVRGCQSAPPLFRIFDRYSTWGLKNGLASVLTAVLTSGILGFPFCIPDYVGGNAYGDDVPSEELLIRWAQVSVAMPAVQFSIPPWHFEGNICERAIKDALRWRESLFWPNIKECIADASDKLFPIARPMWWEEPNREEVLHIHDQFMVGEHLLVAPIIKQSQTSRSVFLPKGTWQRVDMRTCEVDGRDIFGPVDLEDVHANLFDMPVYVRTLADDGKNP